MSDILETSMILMFRTRLIVMDLGERQGYIFHLGNRYQHSWLGYAEKRRKSEKVRWRGGWSSGVPGAMINSCFVVRILMNLSSPYRLISKKWFPLRYWVVIETQCKQIAYILSVIHVPKAPATPFTMLSTAAAYLFPPSPSKMFPLALIIALSVRERIIMPTTFGWDASCSMFRLLAYVWRMEQDVEWRTNKAGANT